MGIGDSRKGIICGGCAFCFLLCLVTTTAFANSYIEMITAAPEGEMPEPMREAEIARRERSVLYAAPVPTAAPVVTSDYPKYVAWRNAQMQAADSSYFHEDVQNVIYFLSGAVIGRMAYDIWGPHHSHHLLDHW